VTRTLRTGIAVLAIAVGACGHGATPATTARTATTAAVPRSTVATTPPGPLSQSVVTTPDLSDVDTALAAIDGDISTADRDVANEGAPSR
jgi:hypothetical protein